MKHNISRQSVISGSLLLLAVVVLLLSGQADASDANRLDITTRTGDHTFSVELALTPSERSQGLMHRKQMDEDAGMLFRFDRVKLVAMWMKNTFIPLDMVFIRPDGSIADIHYNAVPHSEDIIQSSEPVLYVLELNAGVAQKIDLRRDDVVKHPLIGSD